MEQHLTPRQINDILILFEKQIIEANIKGTVFDFLKDHKVSYDEYDEYPYNKKTVRLLIAGQSDVKKEHILGILKRLGIDKNRVDMVLDYDDIKTYRWNNIQFSEKYSDIIFGACPHSVVGKGDYNSIISRMEQEEGWPNVVRASANEMLKFSKQSLTDALMKTDFYTKELSKY